jgi:hypothetical protein
MSEEIQEQKRPSLRLLLFGAVVGVAYGLVVRLGINGPPFSKFGGAMSWAFLFGVPFVIGFVTIFTIERRQRQSFWIWVIWPWISIAGWALGTFLALIEGLICIAMFLPLAMVCASLGGITAGVLLRVSQRAGTNNIVASCVLFFPLLVAPWEHGVLYSKEIRDTQTFVDIKAPASVIWENIERVRAIQPEELQNSWSHRIGFPNPVEATLSSEGVGGVRRATFSGGVLFIETIDVWQPMQRLGFSIKAQTDRIPNTTLDEHVRVGGPFFDVLRGEYRLEPLGNDVIRLHLSSQHRVSTDFNWYARMWTNAIMADLQIRILQVVKARCENGATVEHLGN